MYVFHPLQTFPMPLMLRMMTTTPPAPSKSLHWSALAFSGILFAVGIILLLIARDQSIPPNEALALSANGFVPSAITAAVGFFLRRRYRKLLRQRLQYLATIDRIAGTH
jgi:hypothetical protein